MKPNYPSRIAMAAALTLLLAPAPSMAAAYPITITYPNAPLTFPESDEFAGMIAGKAWDMSNLYDITYRTRFAEPFTPPVNGIWSGTFCWNDLPGFYWPLFRGFHAATTNDLQYFTRHNPGTPYGPLAPVNANYFNRLSIRHSLLAANRSRFSVSWCKTLIENENNSYTIADGDSSQGAPIPYPDGFRIYDMDLSGRTYDADRIPGFSGSLDMHGTWTGTVYGFYLVPSFDKRAGTPYSLDWLRLYHSASNTQLVITWTNAPLHADTNNISMQLYAATNNINDPGNLFLSGIYNDGRMTFHTGALPPGEYYLYLKAVYAAGAGGFDTLGRSAYSPKITIGARPTLEFTAPSFTSGVEYAATDRGNAWDMAGADDIDSAGLFNISGYSFAGGKFQGTTSSGDPQIALSLLTGSGVRAPINTANYRYLTFRMFYDTSPHPSASFASEDARRQSMGSVARLQWAYQNFYTDGSYTKDIILQEGWYDYTVDLWDRALLQTGGDPANWETGWTEVPAVNHLILHPMEPSLPIAFQLDYVKICAPNAPTDDVFPIRWTAGDTDGDSLAITLYYGTGAGATFSGTAITTLANQPTGAGAYNWNTAAVPDGTYTIRAVISDGLNTLTCDAAVPVIVGQPQPQQPALSIQANGTGGTLALNQGDPVTITVAMDAGDYAGAPKDWWSVAWDTGRNQWYYLNSTMCWIMFDGNLALCQPAYQGPLMDLPAREILTDYTLPTGVFNFYFAVDQQDNILNYPDVQSDLVTVTVE